MSDGQGKLLPRARILRVRPEELGSLFTSPRPPGVLDWAIFSSPASEWGDDAIVLIIDGDLYARLERMAVDLAAAQGGPPSVYAEIRRHMGWALESPSDERKSKRQRPQPHPLESVAERRRLRREANREAVLAAVRDLADSSLAGLVLARDITNTTGFGGRTVNGHLKTLASAGLIEYRPGKNKLHPGVARPVAPATEDAEEESF